MNIEPYKGLRPYEEQDKDNFFGRERDKRILTDKILTHKLTFLFAASGVGKSSLLQAGVIPALKQGNDPLDVVYYRDWVSDPLASFKAAVLQFLRDHRLISANYDIDVSLPLDQWLRHCTAFTTEPLVIILDQFEEFFYYQRYTQNFKVWVEQLAYAIHDETTATVFVIAMREDFALELNAFKQYIPFFLIENFYRLEKLTRDQARAAIVMPVEKAGFCYEAELLETLLRELSQREQLERYGIEAMERFHGELPLLVEPPHLQIVCIQLWEASQQHPERKLTLAVYEQKGRATGLLKYYFDHKIVTFSLKEQRIASAAFNYLVNKHGTKMAYPVRDLAQLLRLNEQTLGEVLEKLDQARILRKQSRQGVVWFELYHDVFAKTAYDWNERYKQRQRVKKLLRQGFAAVLVSALVVGGYDYWDNATHAHWRLSPKRGVSDQIEAYQGQPSGFDWFSQRRYLIESDYVFDQIEPSRLFEMKAVTTTEPSSELVKTAFPTAEMVRAYWELGEIDGFLNLAKKILTGAELDLLGSVIPNLIELRSRQTVEEILKISKLYYNGEGGNITIRIGNFDKSWTITPNFSLSSFLIKYLKDSDCVDNIINIIGQLNDNSVTATLIELLQCSEKTRVIEALGELGDRSAVVPLIELLNDSDFHTRHITSIVLGKLGDHLAVAPLIELLNDSESAVREGAARALGQLGDNSAVIPLIELLKDPDHDVRYMVTEALGKLSMPVEWKYSIIARLIKLLQNSDIDIRKNSAWVLSQLGDNSAIIPLTKLLQDSQDSDVRNNVILILGKLGERSMVVPLINLLQDSDSNVRNNAILALGKLGDRLAVTPLIELLKHPDQDESEPRAVIDALIGLGSLAISPLLESLKDSELGIGREHMANILVELGDSSIVTPLIELFKNTNSEEVRDSVAWILGKLGDPSATPTLVELLKYPDSNIRMRTAEILGQLGERSSIIHLTELLNTDIDFNVHSSVIWALVQLGEPAAITPLIKLLKDLPTRTEMSSNIASILMRLERPIYIAPIIDIDGKIHFDLEERKNVIKHIVETLGQFCNQVVFHIIPLLRDPNPEIREQATETLIQLGDQTAISSVADLLENSDNSLTQKDVEQHLQSLNGSHFGKKRDAIIALGQAKVAEALPQIRPMLTNSQENLSLRLATLDALGNNATVGMAEDFIQVIQETPQFFTLKGYHVLGNTGSPVAAEFLQQQLTTYDTCKANWRARRDQDQLSDFDTLRKQLPDVCENFIESEQVVLKTYLESPLAFAIAKLNTEAGIQLLSHNLANVRKGAALGLGMMGSIELLQQLYQQHQRITSTEITQVFKRQAFYRAIDNVLIKLELRGTEDEWQQLKAFAQTVQITHLGIKERVEWTIDQLDFNLHRRIKKIQKVTE